MQSDHILVNGGWMLWRDVELRSAGFPASLIDGLADPALALAVDARAPGVEARFRSALAAASMRLRDLAREPRFREALAWQNRRLLDTCVASLLRQPIGATDTKTRQNERVVASYAMRYCCKNERIGFFGASAPARLVEEGPAIALAPGPALVRSRSTYLEPWAIDALAAALAADPELRAWLFPRVLPTARLEGTVLVHSVDRRAELPAHFAALVAACDGETPAFAIANRLVADPALELESVDEVYGMLEELAGVVSWTLEVPTTGGAPEHLLRRELLRLGDSDARTRALEALARLEAARAQVTAAAGDVSALVLALAALDQVFIELTGSAAVRNHGEAYAGRTLAGEDCVRDVDVAFGPAVTARLAPPLELVLHSARWFTYELARGFREAADSLFSELLEPGATTVELPRFHARLPAILDGDGEARRPLIEAVVTALHARWRAVLAIEPGSRSVERAASALRAAVLTQFAAPGPGWPAARHHSPDVLIAARDVAAVNRGEFLAVLGEVHVGMCSLLVPMVPNRHGDPDAPFVTRDADIGRPTVAPVWSARRSRLDYYSRSPRDFDLELGAARSWRPRSQVLTSADLLLERRAGQLTVRTRDGAHNFDLVEVFEHYLLARAFSAFTLLTGDHQARVVVDGVVLAREKWSFGVPTPGDDLHRFAHAKDALGRFAGARAWAQSVGLPRQVFLKIPEETKPVYVDFASPTFVESAAKLIRKATRVTVSEMLPDLDALWLEDAAGQRYTSELRIVAVDPIAWTPPAAAAG